MNKKQLKTLMMPGLKIKKLGKKQLQIKRPMQLQLLKLLLMLISQLSQNQYPILLHQQNLLLVVVQLPSLWLVSSLFLLPQLVVLSGTRRSKVETRKVVKLMTESFTRAKSPQSTLTRRHKRLLSLTLMYENYQDELKFNFYKSTPLFSLFFISLLII